VADEDDEMKDTTAEASGINTGSPLRQRSLTPMATLPSFPSPAAPDAPSKSVLALQGLDQALLDAEIVDPATSLPIPSGGEDTTTGLSEKTRKRLKDLGIVELFAGALIQLPLKCLP